MAIDQKIYVAADAVVFRKAQESLEIVLIKRKNEPFKDQWCLPGGFVENDEDPKVAAQRELMEETGLVLNNMEQIGAFGQPDRDPRFRNISIAYWGIYKSSESPLGADDALEAAWHSVDNLPTLGFDHAVIIQLALQRYAAFE